MENELGWRRQVVDDKYARPQGLYNLKDVNMKQLRKLILDSELAPCYPGVEESTCDLEECLICFSYYPSLNLSRCCLKGICTECFLQMKVPDSTCPPPCPFCKTSNFEVEYWGVQTKEEKADAMEIQKNQRAVQARIRMTIKEFLDERERMLQKQDVSCSSNRNMAPVQDENVSVGVSSNQFPAMESDEIVSADQSCTASDNRQSFHHRSGR